MKIIHTAPQLVYEISLPDYSQPGFYPPSFPPILLSRLFRLLRKNNICQVFDLQHNAIRFMKNPSKCLKYYLFH
jgi:hypothetical protein